MISSKLYSSQAKSFLKNRSYFLLFLIPYVLFAFFTYGHYGIAIDEPTEYSFGQMLYARTFGHDPILIRDFAVEHENSREIWAYNHFHAMLLYVINDSENIETYHVLNVLFGLVGFYLAFELVFLATKNAPLSLIGPVVLFFTPRFLGDLPANVKDPVFAIYYLLALTAIACIPKYQHWAIRVGCVGIAIGLAAAARVLGYGLIPIFVLFLALLMASDKRSWQKKVVSIVVETVLITVITIAVHALQMPFVAANPFQNLPRLFALGGAYPWQGDMLYLGGIVSSGSLPWHYLFVWIGVITPFFIVLFWLLSPLFWKNIVVQVLHVALWFNVALYFLLRPNIYDGIRHFLVLLVIISVLASITWVRLWQTGTERRRIVLGITLMFFIVSVSFQYSRLHPYEYIYFNEFIGGLAGVNGTFETDYWGTSYKEAAQWLLTELGDTKSTIGVCGNQAAVIYFNGSPHTVKWLEHCDHIAENKVDYVLVFGRNQLWDTVNGDTLHTVSREGLPLVKVIKIQDN